MQKKKKKQKVAKSQKIRIVHEYFKWIVIVNKIVDYQYFMDEMTEYEIELCMKNMHFASKNEWEQTRMIMYTNLSPYMKRGQSKTPQELFPLATDEEQEQTTVTEEEIEQLQQYANDLENFFAQQNKNNETTQNGNITT